MESSKDLNVCSSRGSLLSQDSLFKAFAVSSGGALDQTAGPGFSSSPSKPPAGSRLVQYMQPQQRKQSTTPVTSGTSCSSVLQNGPAAPSFEPANNSVGGKDYLSTGCFIPSSPMNVVPSTSQAPIFHPAHPSVTPPTQTFSQLNVSPHSSEFIPGKMMHSVSNPVFVSEAHQSPFSSGSGSVLVNSTRDTVTPPGRRKISKSPITSEAALASNNSFVQESIGGTMYFYNAEDSQTPTAFARPPDFRLHHSGTNALLPSFYSYNAAPSHLAHFRPKGAGIASFFTPSELKMELMERQILSFAQTNPEQYPDLPQEVDAYIQLVPLEPVPKTSLAEHPGFFMHYVSSTYKAVNSKDGLVYCLRRLHNCRLVNPRCLSMLDTWKKLAHSGIVQLREMCTTKCFGDFSLVYIYDFYPGAETLKYRHFSGMSKANGLTHSLFEEFDGHRLRFGCHSQLQGKFMNGVSGSSSSVPESLIWSYVVQLSSALRAIHAVGLAARTMEPSKILVVGRSKLMINCCGIMDVLTFEQAQHNLPAAIQHYQQEDLVGLGRLVAALCCNSLNAASRENLASSITFVAQNYSQDLKNLVTYLLSQPPGRIRNINDIMPMIGARFYAQLEGAQMRIDMLENELAKEVENGRLFRLLCKLGTVNERPEYNMDPSWSETGDRYLLKLFRDYLFHQVTEDGRPWIDMAHIVHCLNKVDAGTQEKLSLMSRDEQNVLVVSYADLKRCIEQAFQELVSGSGMISRS